MKTQLIYCRECKEMTAHYIQNYNGYGDKGFDRVFFSVFTLGFAEIDNYTIYECSKCGHEIKK